MGVNMISFILNLCKECLRIEKSNRDTEITCTTRNNSRFKDLDSEDNCLEGISNFK